MTVHFIGAGPGAPDLLTLRGRDLIAASPVCLYAGSLVPQALLAHCPPGARVVNTASMSLDEIIAELAAALAVEAEAVPWPELAEHEVEGLTEQYATPEWNESR